MSNWRNKILKQQSKLCFSIPQLKCMFHPIDILAKHVVKEFISDYTTQTSHEKTLNKFIECHQNHYLCDGFAHHTNAWLLLTINRKSNIKAQYILLPLTI